MSVIGDMIRWNDAGYYARDIRNNWVFQALKQKDVPMNDPIAYLKSFCDEVDKQKRMVCELKDKPQMQSRENCRVEVELQRNLKSCKQLRMVVCNNKKQAMSRESQLAKLREERRHLQERIVKKPSLSEQDKASLEMETIKWQEGYNAFYKLKWIIDVNLYHVVFYIC